VGSERPAGSEGIQDDVGRGWFLKSRDLTMTQPVVKRLDDAGAVLVAKMTMGALAQGDLWFGARTRNPWNKRQGSSGSSAGSASAVAMGASALRLEPRRWVNLFAFDTMRGYGIAAIHLGFVPRTGAMALKLDDG